MEQIWPEKKVLMPVFSERAFGIVEKKLNTEIFSEKVEPRVFKDEHAFFQNRMVIERAQFNAVGFDISLLEKDFFWFCFKEARTRARIKKIFSRSSCAVPHFLMQCRGKPERIIGVALMESDLEVFRKHQYLAKDKFEYLLAAYLDGHNDALAGNIESAAIKLCPQIKTKLYAFDGYLFKHLRANFSGQLQEIVFLIAGMRNFIQRDLGIFRYLPNALVVY